MFEDRLQILIRKAETLGKETNCVIVVGNGRAVHYLTGEERHMTVLVRGLWVRHYRGRSQGCPIGGSPSLKLRDVHQCQGDG